jgi:hypothetical protein
VTIGLVGVLVVVGGVTSLGQRGADWRPIVEQLRSQPSPELLAELVSQVLERFSAGVSERIVPLLNPQQTILYCAGTGCLGLVLVTPPGELIAGQIRTGTTRAYNQGEIVGLLGTFGNTIAPDVEGFFLLRSNPDGSMGLLDENGEQVTTIGALHTVQMELPADLSSRLEKGSLLLPEWTKEETLSIEAPAVDILAESRSAVQIRIGTTDDEGLFTGVVLCGAIPITVP